MAIHKKIDDPTALALPITGSVTYPGTGGSFSIPNNMGGSFTVSNNIWRNDNSVKPIDHAISGQMLTVTRVIDHFVMEQVDENDIKISMISQLAEEMIKNKCVEFTKQKGERMNETIIRARIFVTPDTNVRIIREWLK